MSSRAHFFELIKQHDVKYIDVRFTDPKGKCHHMSLATEIVNDDLFNDGVTIDGSSIQGWREINDSDMVLMPDASTAVMDPFASQSTLIVYADTHDPMAQKPYNRDPRSIARKAEEYLASQKIGDKAYFGPELEFFVFEDVRFAVKPHQISFHLDSIESPHNTSREYPTGNMGHRPEIKGGYFPVPPLDSMMDLRAEMLTVMNAMGLGVERHHHEVAPSQNELGIRFDTLVRAADKTQTYKYVVQNVANSYGKSATFMPKPIMNDNGSGMHVHQSVWKDGTPLFAGNGYADLSETALHYIGGIIKHARTINAFTNPTTNSYKRLIPGFEAPVLLAYSARNRSASCRIPYSADKNAKRVEVRFPDPTANPYLGFSAMLMAGIDGIKNKIDPGAAMDKNLYKLSPEELKTVPTVCGSLREALHHLENDADFLMQGDVFTKDFLNAYIELKWEEVYRFEHTPHPVEFEMYYSA